MAFQFLAFESAARARTRPFADRRGGYNQSLYSSYSDRFFQGTTMSEFVTVAKVGDIPEGRGISCLVGDTVVGVFNDGGRYFAINDLCPHMGASLADGELENGVVACPWHAWRFRVCDGTWCDNPRIKTDSYEVRVAGDQIQVRV